MTVEVREARPHELADAGAATARAYEEFFGPGGFDEHADYLDRIRDAAGRAERTTILVALDHGVIVGSLTLELHLRTNPDDDPLAPERANIRMLGVDPRRGHGAPDAR